ncbi:hypothetical protein ACA910_017375 [Epithemia clementina (nom. ined.)]
MIRAASKAVKNCPPSIYAAKLPPSTVARTRYIESKKGNDYVKQIKKVYKFRESIRPAIEHGPAPDLENVSPVSLRQVAENVNHIHNDRVVYLKTTYEAHTVVGVSVLVEDDNGDNIMLSLYNFVQEGIDPNEIIGPGTYIALLAKYMKNERDDRTKCLMLRCDNPQCVIIYDSQAEWTAAKTGKLAPTQEYSQSASSLRTLGNASFLKNRWLEAFQMYSMALKSASISQRDRIACLANRAEVSLRQGHWERAVEDSAKVLELEPLHINARFRLAKARLRLGQASDALIYAEALAKSPYQTENIKTLVADCKKVILEQERGQYNLVEMRKEACLKKAKSAFELPFHGDFAAKESVGFGVEMQSQTHKSYRGCVAKRHLPEDFLVCASKAFVYVPRQESSVTEYALHCSRVDDACQVEMVKTIAQLIQARPEMGSCFYHLSAGNRKGLSSDDKKQASKIDLPLIRDIVETNAFATCDHGKVIQDKWAQQTLRESGVHDDTKQMCELLKNQTTARGAGLWLRESLLNHSCTPNCAWTLIGDHMFVRTTRPVERGEELCVSYVAEEISFKKRTEIFESWTGLGNGFSCRCQWCSAIRGDPTLQEIESTVAKAYQRAGQLVSTTLMSMKDAAETVLPVNNSSTSSTWKQNIQMAIQHRAGQNLHILQGSILSAIAPDRKMEALRSYQKAADIGYAVRGSGAITLERAKDCWRVVGAALACRDEAQAMENLGSIWKGSSFKYWSSQSETIECFKSLTVRYALPWWWDPQDRKHGSDIRSMHMVKVLVDMVDQICRS